MTAILKDIYGYTVGIYNDCTSICPTFIICKRYGKTARIDAYGGNYFEKAVIKAQT